MVHPPLIRNNGIPTETIAGQRDPDARHVLLEFSPPKIIGSGTFGCVYSARIALTSEPIAIKRVLKEQYYRSRELDLLRTLDHPNVIYMKFYFQTINEDLEEHIHFVMEYMPKSLHQLLSGYRRTHQNMPKFTVMLYMFQVCRALHYIHLRDICHRDVKTQNILVDPTTNVVKLGDFGSAKRLHLNEPSLSYICSRYYRAPELLLSFTQYTCAIDIWSAGICMVELLTGDTPFSGATDKMQLTEIAQVLGAPPRNLLDDITKRYAELCMPERPSRRIKEMLPSHVPPSAVKLLKAILQYDWTHRPSAIEMCAHEFFDELRLEKGCGQRGMPPIFAWGTAEFGDRADLINKILPKHAIPMRSAPAVA